MFRMMNYGKFLCFLCIWNAQHFIKAETKSINDDISEEFYSCDYTRFENQLERLKLQASVNHQAQLSQQKELFNSMQKTLNDLYFQIEGIQEKLIQANRNPMEDLKVLIRHETQTQVPIVTPAVDDKNLVLIDIKEKLKDHDHKMSTILSTQNEIQQLFNKIHLEDPAQTMKNIISEKFSNIERNFMSKNISQVILNNQNDIKNLLKAINLDDHTHTLKSTISHEVAAIQKIDEKLTNIDRNSVTKIDQLKFYDDIKQYLNATELCRKGENNNLSFTQGMTPTHAVHYAGLGKVERGTNRQSYPTSCANFDANHCAANKCRIKNDLYGPETFLVSCNDRVEGGGWTVIQRRINGSVDFYRNWSEYKVGFGDIDGEFFIGLEKLHALTSTLKPMELLIQLGDFDNVIKYAKYDDFQVGDETENFKLIKVGTYDGDAGDSLSRYVDNHFSTKDQDNDKFPNYQEAISCTGAWWYGGCYWSNLNGKYYQDPKHKLGIVWYSFHGYEYSLKFVQMSIRPKKAINTK